MAVVNPENIKRRKETMKSEKNSSIQKSGKMSNERPNTKPTKNEHERGKGGGRDVTSRKVSSPIKSPRNGKGQQNAQPKVISSLDALRLPFDDDSKDETHIMKLHDSDGSSSIELMKRERRGSNNFNKSKIKYSEDSLQGSMNMILNSPRNLEKDKLSSLHSSLPVLGRSPRKSHNYTRYPPRDHKLSGDNNNNNNFASSSSFDSHEKNESDSVSSYLGKSPLKEDGANNSKLRESRFDQAYAFSNHNKRRQSLHSSGTELSAEKKQTQRRNSLPSTSDTEAKKPPKQKKQSQGYMALHSPTKTEYAKYQKKMESRRRFSLPISTTETESDDNNNNNNVESPKKERKSIFSIGGKSSNDSPPQEGKKVYPYAKVGFPKDRDRVSTVQVRRRSYGGQTLVSDSPRGGGRRSQLARESFANRGSQRFQKIPSSPKSNSRKQRVGDMTSLPVLHHRKSHRSLNSTDHSKPPNNDGGIGQGGRRKNFIKSNSCRRPHMDTEILLRGQGQSFDSRLSTLSASTGDFSSSLQSRSSLFSHNKSNNNNNKFNNSNNTKKLSSSAQQEQQEDNLEKHSSSSSSSSPQASSPTGSVSSEHAITSKMTKNELDVWMSDSDDDDDDDSDDKKGRKSMRKSFRESIKIDVPHMKDPTRGAKKFITKRLKHVKVISDFIDT